MENFLSDRLFKAIEDRVARVQEYVLSPRYLDLFSPEDMREAVTCYFESGGKRLRPAVMLFCCGAVGGDEEKAISAAAAVEIFHTWTLVHDDIIDRDPLRRGAPTVHERFRVKPSTIARFGNGGDAAHYGVSIAVLTGDVQHGWGISLMTELTRKFGIAPEVTLTLINELDTRVLCTLVEGEVLDVQYSKEPIENLSSEQIEEMLWKKTGALYEFAGASGAAIGLNTPDLKHPLVRTLEQFTSACGAAFQLQDDILGVVGDEKLLGKPVGADIREGKRTVIARESWVRADARQRKLIDETLGNVHAPQDQIEEVTKLFVSLGGVEETARRATAHVERGLKHLEPLPQTQYREWLSDWAHYMIDRTF